MHFLIHKGYLFHPGVFSRDWHTVESLSLGSHSVSGVKIHLESSRQAHVTINKRGTEILRNLQSIQLRGTYPRFCHIFVLPTPHHLGINRKRNMVTTQHHPSIQHVIRHRKHAPARRRRRKAYFSLCGRVNGLVHSHVELRIKHVLD